MDHLLKNITSDVIRQAIKRIDSNPSLRKNRDAILYDLVVDNEKYPPILVLSEANKILGGTELTIRDLANSTKSAFKYLANAGFPVTARTSEFPQIQDFLEQSRTNDLSTKKYVEEYDGLEVNVSFGKGNNARIPWMAFLSSENTVQKGIYPVYLFFKEKNLLVLAYGISETNTPPYSWPIENLKKISDYFKENTLGKPDRYGGSFIYKVYDISSPIDHGILKKDLNALLDTYKEIVKAKPSQLAIKKSDQLIDAKFDYKSFQEASVKGNLSYSTNLFLRFTAALLTKPFVLLTGLSGSGKTKLAQAFAMWISANENQYCVVPVGADWTNREPLLGFPNALIENDYKTDDYGVLKLIIEANNNIDKPYFLILDEMNLSHVERYFADFLSVMESGCKISLHSGNKSWSGIPPEISIPRNLFIIGTVNIDETTYMFSPKVLDRANVIEFRVTQNAMKNYLEGNSRLNLESLIGHGKAMAVNFVELAKDPNLESKESGELTKALIIFFTELKRNGAEFGYRSASEILRFAAVVSRIDSTWSTSEIMDAAIMQKLLPKVHGSQRKLGPILKSLGNLCLANNYTIDNLLIANTEIVYADQNKIKYPISLEKIIRMTENLTSNGFTSYAEA